MCHPNIVALSQLTSRLMPPSPFPTLGYNYCEDLVIWRLLLQPLLDFSGTQYTTQESLERQTNSLEGILFFFLLNNANRLSLH